MFFNTTNDSGTALATRRRDADAQDAAILAVFRQVRQATPSDVWSLCNTAWPLTSVRRAITTLTAAGKLVKTDAHRPGLYGKPETVWRLADDRREPIADRLF